MTGEASALLSMADKVRAIALEGLSYATHSYDRERYEKLLRIASQSYADCLGLDVGALTESFRQETGCITPKLGTDAAVLDDGDKLLVLKRADNTGWCLPCGWVDPGESPAMAAVREVKEETDLDVEALGYLSVSRKGPGRTQNVLHQVNVVTLVRLVSDPSSLKLNHEHLDHRWIGKGESFCWHPGHDDQARKVFEFVERNGQAGMLAAE